MVWNSEAPMKLLQDMPSTLNAANLARLQQVIDIDKYANSAELGRDLCGEYAPFCFLCDKSLHCPCAVAYVKMRQHEGFDVKIDLNAEEEKAAAPEEPKTYIRIAKAVRKKADGSAPEPLPRKEREAEPAAEEEVPADEAAPAEEVAEEEVAAEEVPVEEEPAEAEPAAEDEIEVVPIIEEVPVEEEVAADAAAPAEEEVAEAEEVAADEVPAEAVAEDDGLDEDASKAEDAPAAEAETEE
ncbi:MAG: hypothetical protein LUD51_00330 [Clostridia bacterium]|nr:hypothetical protein [Clostridia bacterium]